MNLHLLMESQVATLTDLTRCFYLVEQLKNSCALIDQELPVLSARVQTDNANRAFIVQCKCLLL